MQYSEDLSQRIQDCREIYLKYGGQKHELIEQEMRCLGYHDFHRRCLYRRFERGTMQPGWPETYGWNSQLKMRNSECGIRNDAMQAVTIPHSKFPIPHSDEIRHSKPAPHLKEWDEFKAWLKRTWPGLTWEWKHQVYIYKHLKRVWDGKCKRLMIFTPPRHGKSELVTVRFPAWTLKHNPETKVIIGSYNQRLANRFSRMVRSALAEDAAKSAGKKVSEPPASAGGMDADTNTVRGNAQRTTSDDQNTQRNLPPANAGGSDSFFTRNKNSESEWELEQGGGVRAVGVGAGVTGYGAHLIVIDDPVKSRAEAESETFRDKVWHWFNDDIYTRLEPDGKIILIQTRWHEDDLAGRLLREAAEEGGEQWEVINLPALAEPEDVLGRAEGEALCPKRYDEKKLARIQRKIGSYSFAALYQQRPAPADGGQFKRSWFRKIVDAAPEGLSWKRGYDLAVSTKETADYTASFRCAKDMQGNLYIADGFRARIEYPDQRRYILGRMRDEPSTEHGIEAALHGRAFVQDLRREVGLGRYAFRAVAVDADKLTRALTWLNLAEEGKVYLVRGTWIDAFVDEIARFPTGRHNDQIDAVSLAVNMLDRRRYKAVGF